MKILSTCIVLALTMVGCGQGSQTTLSSQIQPGASEQIGGGADDMSSQIKFCSKLSFAGMKTPQDLSLADLNHFALALNISSSFEGPEFWRNITNNFDGQGLSLGLLNQTLGTGSLQPLLLEMLQAHPVAMKASFSQSNFKSLEKMILDWKTAEGLSVRAQSEELFAAESDALSSLDASSDFIIKTFASSEDASVSWAVRTIYTSTSGKTFKPDWKKQLQDMCATAEYRSIQFEAARYLHERSKEYQQTFGLSQLRSYLFLFDVMVQNGGFYKKNLEDFKAFMKSNPRATEEQKLYALLNSRLVQVKNEFKKDVKARKESIIKGTGVVHGNNRNYEREYCYTSNSAL